MLGLMTGGQDRVLLSSRRNVRKQLQFKYLIRELREQTPTWPGQINGRRPSVCECIKKEI